MSIPVPENLSYLPYQKEGIIRMAKMNNVLLADPMGLGKTIQVLGLINLMKYKSILIICPAIVKYNWKKEACKWITGSYSYGVVEGRNKDAIIENNFVIVNFAIVQKNMDAILSREWDLLVVDEAHYLKEQTSGRTKTIIMNPYYGYDQPGIPAKKKIFVTGTPIENRPREIWPLCYSLDKSLFPVYNEFGMRYCNGWINRIYTKNGVKEKYNFEGSSNCEELFEKLQDIMIRRDKLEVLPQLPAKTEQLCIVGKGKQEKGIKQLLLKVQEALAILLEKELLGETNISREIEKLEFTKKLLLDEMAVARKVAGMAKVPFMLEEIKNCLSQQDKLVVFAYHKDVIAAIMEEFKDIAVCITGATPAKKREDIKNRFQDDKDVKLFVGNIVAAGVGITLTAASTVLFCELDWRPGKMEQASDRVWRIGQDNKVLVKYLVLDNTIDARIGKSIVRKQKVISTALDGACLSELNNHFKGEK